MNYTIVRYDRSRLSLLPHPQEPLMVIGRLVPSYDGSQWKTTEELFESPIEKKYADDSFNPTDYIDNPHQAAFLALLGGHCIGSIRVCRRWNRNAFIDDLAVDYAHRGHGVGTLLMDAAVGWGRENKLRGVSLETQDWNLLACRFYLKYGFTLGGADSHVYDELPPSRGETALYFYLLG